MPDLLKAFELCAKTVRTLLTTPQLTRPFREPFTPVSMRGETWLAEAEEEREVWDAPLSATFTDEPTVQPPEEDLDYDGPVGEFCFGYNQYLPMPGEHGYVPLSPAVSATDSAVEDPPADDSPPPGADSQIVELTSNAEERVANWLRASIRHGKSNADLVRGVQRLIAVSDKK